MKSTLTVLAIATTALGGCAVGGDFSGNIKTGLGLQQSAPDEFIVVPRRPLTLPRTKTLSVPQPGAPSLVDPNPIEEAKAALGRGPDTASQTSQAEQALVAAAGDKADPDIRATIDGELESALANNQYGLDTFLGRPTNPAARGDPFEKDQIVEETERLQAEGYRVPVNPKPES